MSMTSLTPIVKRSGFIPRAETAAEQDREMLPNLLFAGMSLADESLTAPKQGATQEFRKPQYNSKDDIYLYAKTFKSQVKIGPLYKVLTLGEADFSFARAYITAYPHCSMLATRYEGDDPNDPEATVYRKLSRNVEFLRDNQVKYLSNVDATNVGEDWQVRLFSQEETWGHIGLFDKIFFNFPYLPSGKIAPAKTAVPAMLRKFIQSAGSLLAPGGEIIIGGYSDSFRSQYYTVEKLQELGFSLPQPGSTFPKASDWDKHKLLSKHGYRHRDSGQDFSTNPEPTFTNSKRYVFVKTTKKKIERL